MIFRFSIILFSLIFSQEEFSDGPYGQNYFDTAGPFTVQDLNSPISGDVNSDEILNIQDIILVIGNVLGTIDLNLYQEDAADLNNDNIIDILDIVQLVNGILNPESNGWDFASNWNGQESYIFIHFHNYFWIQNIY